jgi:heat shock protein 4
MEDWLYEEGEDEKKSVYITKLQELRARGDPIEQRAADASSRGPAVEELESICNQYLSLADSSVPAHAHLEAGDREALRKEAGEALAWLQEKVALQAQVGAGFAAGHV